MNPFDQHQDLRLGDGPIRLYRAGPTTGVPVVLLHGAMFDTAPLIWRDLMPRLAAERQVVAIDLPRHGGSRPWPGVVDQATCERILRELLDHLQAPRADLIGLSMGAGIAIGFALGHPQRIRSLVVAAPGGLDERRPWQFLTWLALRSATVLRWMSYVLAGSTSMLRKSMAATLAAGERTKGFEEIMRLGRTEAQAKRQHREPALDDWQVRAFGPRRMRLNFQPHLHRLAPPSLWLRGADDPLVAEATMRQAVEAAPDARFETIPDAGHLSPLDQPDRFGDLTETFLHRIDLARLQR